MADSLSPAQLVDILQAEQRRCWEQGNRIPAEALLRRHAALPADGAHALELVYHEILLREELGEAPCLDEYLRRFPQLGAQLAPLFEVHAALEAAESELASSAADSDPKTGTTGTWPDSPGAPLATLPVIPGYEVLGELGRGGMGLVYRARDVRLDRLVALKMLRTGAQAEAAELARFRAEAEAQARLQHANIVEIFEIGEVDGGPYFALEYVDGGSLAHQLADTVPPPRRAAQLLEVLARAVHYAHQRGLIHRDLKPANVLLTAAGVPKITDFGLVKRLDGGAGPTRSGEVLGTPRYMAPEQATGQVGAVGPATDVYALGALLYELLTGRPPFLAETALETLLQVKTQEPVPPRRLQPKLPRDLETICLKCLCKEPGKRYADAEALADDLRRFQAGEPIRARPVGWIERLGRWGRRNPALAAASGLAAAALVAATVLSFLFAWHQSQTAGRLRAEKQQTETALRAVQRHSTLSALDHGLLLCERGDAPRGLLWLVRSLQEAPPEGMEDYQQVLRRNLVGWCRQLHPLTACLGHDSGVRAVAWSRDGQILVTGGMDGAARLWTLQGKSWIPLGEPFQHVGEIHALALSPDGQVLATGGTAKIVVLWDVATSKELRRLTGHEDLVTAVAFSSDGKTILTGSQDKTARLWETGSGTALGRLDHPYPVFAVTFCPQDETLVTGFADWKENRGDAWLWDAKTRQVRREFHCNFRVRAVAISPQDTWLATGSSDGMVRLWDVATGETKKEFDARFQHERMVTSIGFSPDGQTLLTGSEDHTARLWDSTTGQPLGSPLPHGSGVPAVAFRPDGDTLVTASLDTMVRLWKRSTIEASRKPLEAQGVIRAAAFRVDSKLLVTGGDDRAAQLWEVATGRLVGAPFRHGAAVWAVAFSPDGKRLVTGGEDHQARLWDAADAGKPLGTLPHQGAVREVAMNCDGQTMLTCDRSGTVSLWKNPTAGENPQPLTLTQSNRLIPAAFSPDGQSALTGGGAGYCGVAKLWEVSTGRRKNEFSALSPRQGPFTAIAFCSPSRFLTGSADGTVQLWDVATGMYGPPVVQDSRFLRLTFGPDGRTFLTAGRHGAAQLWDVATGKPIGPPFRHGFWITALAVSPDGRTVLTAGRKDKRAWLWQTPAPASGEVEQLRREVEVLTGMKLTGDGAVGFLDAPTWTQQHQDLKE